MQPEVPPETETYIPITPPKRSFWAKLGGGSLSISIFLHLILLVIGVIWVLKIIPPEEPKVVDFMGKSGGGGSPTSVSQAQKQRAQLTRPNLSRVSADGVMSNIVLPELDEFTQMTSVGSIAPGGLAGGLGGAGSGGGKGNGTGIGIGNGAFAGMSDGKGNKNPFGALTLDRSALVGSFYDLKQTRDRQPTEMTDDEMRVELREITRRGFREQAFAKYFKAPRQLYQSKLFIPAISADAAPAAFDVEKEVKPRRWLVAYRGFVQPPKSGKFRFVGEGDDVLVVRFNNRPVFDYGYTIAGNGFHSFGRSRDLDGSVENAELAKDLRRNTPMKVPFEFYKYANTSSHNQHIGGLAVGPTFDAKEGQTYPIEILIGEIPGGSFSVHLMIEEIGVEYQKDPAGFPILPIFRLDESVPDPALKGEMPPFDAYGPVWKSVAGTMKEDI
ncbi:MAG: hypothetical protein V4640_09830 [Verrucomicrobiota bacterium]